MQTTTSREVTIDLISLGEVEGREHEVGRKAANLGAALAAGFPVPDGVVLTAAADLAASATLPVATGVRLREALNRLGGPVAVRSSALAEDLEDASFAGQYETILGVEGFEAVLEAIHCCWASASSERVLAYGRGRMQADRPGVAVLIQRMVPADAAGVAFTANPITGDRSETLVSAVRGIGDRLVSGESSPDEWSIRGDTVVCRSMVEGAINGAQARAVATLARRVEEHFGAPQDIEWAFADGELFLLQARPITTLSQPNRDQERIEPVPVPVEVPAGCWAREASHAPRPSSPMTRSLIFARRNAAFRLAFEKYGMLAETLELREIGGWEYARLVPPAGQDGSPPPPPLMWLLARLHPALRRRVQAAKRAMRDDLPGRAITRWHEELRPRIQARVHELRDVQLPELSDADLLDHWAKIDALLDEVVPVHFDLHPPIALARKELVDTCRELLGWSEPRALELLGGLSKTSTLPGVRLAELVKLAQQQPAVLAFIEASTGERPGVGELAVLNPVFARAFDAYQREFGIRGLRYDVAEITLAEAPEITLATLRDQLRRDYDPASHLDMLDGRRTALLQEARVTLAAQPGTAGERFERALQRAEQAHPAHEENEFFTVSAPIALARYGLLELGRRFTHRGLIDKADDVFVLEIDEAIAAFTTGADLHALVTRRQGEQSWVLDHPGPASYGPPPGPLPALQALPREARTVMEAVLWAVDRSMATERSAQRQIVGANQVTGLAASPGKYTGTVRVVMGEHEFGKIEAGDVLVCPVTSPVWSVLFSRVGALVTDSGGILSHPAIIAREYGIPAIVATGNATALVQDGQTVTVDGDSGIMEIL